LFVDENNNFYNRNLDYDISKKNRNTDLEAHKELSKAEDQYRIILDSCLNVNIKKVTNLTTLKEIVHKLINLESKVINESELYSLLNNFNNNSVKEKSQINDVSNNRLKFEDTENDEFWKLSDNKLKGFQKNNNHNLSNTLDSNSKSNYLKEKLNSLYCTLNSNFKNPTIIIKHETNEVKNLNEECIENYDKHSRNSLFNKNTNNNILNKNNDLIKKNDDNVNINSKDNIFSDIKDKIKNYRKLKESKNLDVNEKNRFENLLLEKEKNSRNFSKYNFTEGKDNNTSEKNKDTFHNDKLLKYNEVFSNESKNLNPSNNNKNDMNLQVVLT
jgi:hypothetical protein